MDDCLSGSSDVNKFETLKTELSELLQKGGIHLHKWCCSGTPTREPQTFPLYRNSEEVTVKTLGMLWGSSTDTFTCKVTVNTNSNFTKRDVLSDIARIYDPLGFLGPFITKAKIFMQQLWLLQIDWHEKLPPDIAEQCDITSRLLCSKSQVAPIKPVIELSACLLLSQLLHKVIRALKLNIDSIQFFTDSSVALSWINSSSHLLKTFVRNRVVQIQELSKDFHWKHVSSKFNPADLLSRGLEAKTLAASELWWKGPDLSRINLFDYQTLQSPSSSTDKLYSDELKTLYKVTLKSNNDSNFLDTLIDITNNFHKLIRILGFIFRFKSNCKSLIKSTGPLTQEEYQKAETHLLKSLQVKYFHKEISALKKGTPVSPTSKLKFLYPFIDPSRD
ncbi:uncharacterized protein NPIL_79101 [Nephila pilipes]|uniref:Uncharacterized protein n=1 Tax=Nephila pilipes TaxID=299642 RepID=A0A8X6T5R0_NEPPI|nr:uncharacterized protein NPIL_79101 [Nephila pilipes]